MMTAAGRRSAAEAMAREHSTFRRYMRALSTEERRHSWAADIWQPAVLLAWALVAWGISQLLAPYQPPLPAIDYAAFFHGKAEHLGNHTVRLTYDFEPSEDPLNRYPQLQDWRIKRGVLKGEGWLVGDASLNVAFEDRVSVAFRFRLHSGHGLMPAIGVRGAGKVLSYVAVLIERDGKVWLLKYVAGMPRLVHHTDAGFLIEPEQVRRLEIFATQFTDTIDTAEVYADARPMELDTHPELLGSPGLQEALAAPANAGKPKVTGAIEAPCVRVRVLLDGAEIMAAVVPGYELKGWVSLLAWNSIVLYDDVVVTGRLYPPWIVMALRTQQALGPSAAPGATE